MNEEETQSTQLQLRRDLKSIYEKIKQSGPISITTEHMIYVFDSEDTLARLVNAVVYHNRQVCGERLDPGTTFHRTLEAPEGTETLWRNLAPHISTPKWFPSDTVIPGYLYLYALNAFIKSGNKNIDSICKPDCNEKPEVKDCVSQLLKRSDSLKMRFLSKAHLDNVTLKIKRLDVLTRINLLEPKQHDEELPQKNIDDLGEIPNSSDINKFEKDFGFIERNSRKGNTAVESTGFQTQSFGIEIPADWNVCSFSVTNRNLQNSDEIPLKNDDRLNLDEETRYLIGKYVAMLVQLRSISRLAQILMDSAPAGEDEKDLESERLLQEDLNTLKADWLKNFAAMKLSFIKRGLYSSMFSKLERQLSLVSESKLFETALEDRVKIGATKYIELIKKKQKISRWITKGFQIILSAFAATEIVKTVTDWFALYMHRTNYDFFVNLTLRNTGYGAEREKHVQELLESFHSFEFGAAVAMSTIILFLIIIFLFGIWKSKGTFELIESENHH